MNLPLVEGWVRKESLGILGGTVWLRRYLRVWSPVRVSLSKDSDSPEKPLYGTPVTADEVRGTFPVEFLDPAPDAPSHLLFLLALTTTRRRYVLAFESELTYYAVYDTLNNAPDVVDVLAGTFVDQAATPEAVVDDLLSPQDSHDEPPIVSVNVGPRTSLQHTFRIKGFASSAQSMRAVATSYMVGCCAAADAAPPSFSHAASTFPPPLPPTGVSAAAMVAARHTVSRHVCCVGGWDAAACSTLHPRSYRSLSIVNFTTPSLSPVRGAWMKGSVRSDVRSTAHDASYEAWCSMLYPYSFRTKVMKARKGRGWGERGGALVCNVASTVADAQLDVADWWRGTRSARWHAALRGAFCAVGAAANHAECELGQCEFPPEVVRQELRRVGGVTRSALAPFVPTEGSTADEPVVFSCEVDVVCGGDISRGERCVLFVTRTWLCVARDAAIVHDPRLGVKAIQTIVSGGRSLTAQLTALATAPLPNSIILRKSLRRYRVECVVPLFSISALVEQPSLTTRGLHCIGLVLPCATTDLLLSFRYMRAEWAQFVGLVARACNVVRMLASGHSASDAGVLRPPSEVMDALRRSFWAKSFESAHGDLVGVPFVQVYNIFNALRRSKSLLPLVPTPLAVGADVAASLSSMHDVSLHSIVHAADRKAPGRVYPPFPATYDDHLFVSYLPHIGTLFAMNGDAFVALSACVRTYNRHRHLKKGDSALVVTDKHVYLFRWDGSGRLGRSMFRRFAVEPLGLSVVVDVEVDGGFAIRGSVVSALSGHEQPAPYDVLVAVSGGERERCLSALSWVYGRAAAACGLPPSLRVLPRGVGSSTAVSLRALYAAGGLSTHPPPQVVEVYEGASWTAARSLQLRLRHTLQLASGGRPSDAVEVADAIVQIPYLVRAVHTALAADPLHLLRRKHSIKHDVEIAAEWLAALQTPSAVAVAVLELLYDNRETVAENAEDDIVGVRGGERVVADGAKPSRRGDTHVRFAEGARLRLTAVRLTARPLCSLPSFCVRDDERSSPLPSAGYGLAKLPTTGRRMAEPHITGASDMVCVVSADYARRWAVTEVFDQGEDGRSVDPSFVKLAFQPQPLLAAEGACAAAVRWGAATAIREAHCEDSDVAHSSLAVYPRCNAVTDTLAVVAKSSYVMSSTATSLLLCAAVGRVHAPQPPALSVGNLPLSRQISLFTSPATRVSGGWPVRPLHAVGCTQATASAVSGALRGLQGEGCGVWVDRACTAMARGDSVGIQVCVDLLDCTAHVVALRGLHVCIRGWLRSVGVIPNMWWPLAPPEVQQASIQTSAVRGRPFGPRRVFCLPSETDRSTEVSVMDRFFHAAYSHPSNAKLPYVKFHFATLPAVVRILHTSAAGGRSVPQEWVECAFGASAFTYRDASAPTKSDLGFRDSARYWSDKAADAYLDCVPDDAIVRREPFYDVLRTLGAWTRGAVFLPAAAVATSPHYDGHHEEEVASGRYPSFVASDVIGNPLGVRVPTAVAHAAAVDVVDVDAVEALVGRDGRDAISSARCVAPKALSRVCGSAKASRLLPERASAVAATHSHSSKGVCSSPSTWCRLDVHEVAVLLTAAAGRASDYAARCAFLSADTDCDDFLQSGGAVGAWAQLLGEELPPSQVVSLLKGYGCKRGGVSGFSLSGFVSATLYLRDHERMCAASATTVAIASMMWEASGGRRRGRGAITSAALAVVLRACRFGWAVGAKDISISVDVGHSAALVRAVERAIAATTAQHIAAAEVLAADVGGNGSVSFIQLLRILSYLTITTERVVRPRVFVPTVGPLADSGGTVRAAVQSAFLCVSVGHRVASLGAVPQSVVRALQQRTFLESAAHALSRLAAASCLTAGYEELCGVDYTQWMSAAARQRSGVVSDEEESQCGGLDEGVGLSTLRNPSHVVLHAPAVHHLMHVVKLSLALDVVRRASAELPHSPLKAMLSTPLGGWKLLASSAGGVTFDGWFSAVASVAYGEQSRSAIAQRAAASPLFAAAAVRRSFETATAFVRSSTSGVASPGSILTSTLVGACVPAVILPMRLPLSFKAVATDTESPSSIPPSLEPFTSAATVVATEWDASAVDRVAGDLLSEAAALVSEEAGSINERSKQLGVVSWGGVADALVSGRLGPPAYPLWTPCVMSLHHNRLPLQLLTRILAIGQGTSTHITLGAVGVALRLCGVEISVDDVYEISSQACRAVGAGALSTTVSQTSVIALSVACLVVRAAVSVVTYSVGTATSHLFHLGGSCPFGMSLEPWPTAYNSLELPAAAVEAVARGPLWAWVRPGGISAAAALASLALAREVSVVSACFEACRGMLRGFGDLTQVSLVAVAEYLTIPLSPRLARQVHALGECTAAEVTLVALNEIATSASGASFVSVDVEAQLSSACTSVDSLSKLLVEVVARTLRSSSASGGAGHAALPLHASFSAPLPLASSPSGRVGDVASSSFGVVSPAPLAAALSKLHSRRTVSAGGGMRRSLSGHSRSFQKGSAAQHTVPNALDADSGVVANRADASQLTAANIEADKEYHQTAPNGTVSNSTHVVNVRGGLLEAVVAAVRGVVEGGVTTSHVCDPSASVEVLAGGCKVPPGVAVGVVSVRRSVRSVVESAVLQARRRSAMTMHCTVRVMGAQWDAGSGTSSSDSDDKMGGPVVTTEHSAVDGGVGGVWSDIIAQSYRSRAVALKVRRRKGNGTLCASWWGCIRPLLPHTKSDKGSGRRKAAQYPADGEGAVAVESTEPLAQGISLHTSSDAVGNGSVGERSQSQRPTKLSPRGGSVGTSPAPPSQSLLIMEPTGCAFVFSLPVGPIYVSALESATAAAAARLVHQVERAVSHPHSEGGALQRFSAALSDESIASDFPHDALPSAFAATLPAHLTAQHTVLHSRAYVAFLMQRGSEHKRNLLGYLVAAVAEVCEREATASGLPQHFSEIGGSGLLYPAADQTSTTELVDTNQVIGPHVAPSSPSPSGDVRETVVLLHALSAILQSLSLFNFFFGFPTASEALFPSVGLPPSLFPSLSSFEGGSSCRRADAHNISMSPPPRHFSPPSLPSRYGSLALRPPSALSLTAVGPHVVSSPYRTFSRTSQLFGGDGPTSSSSSGSPPPRSYISSPTIIPRGPSARLGLLRHLARHARASSGRLGSGLLSSGSYRSLSPPPRATFTMPPKRSQSAPRIASPPPFPPLENLTRPFVPSAPLRLHPRGAAVGIPLYLPLWTPLPLPTLVLSVLADPSSAPPALTKDGLPAERVLAAALLLGSPDEKLHSKTAAAVAHRGVLGDLRRCVWVVATIVARCVISDATSPSTPPTLSRSTTKVVLAATERSAAGSRRVPLKSLALPLKALVGVKGHAVRGSGSAQSCVTNPATRWAVSQLIPTAIAHAIVVAAGLQVPPGGLPRGGSDGNCSVCRQSECRCSALHTTDLFATVSAACDVVDSQRKCGEGLGGALAPHPSADLCVVAAHPAYPPTFSVDVCALAWSIIDTLDHADDASEVHIAMHAAWGAVLRTTQGTPLEALTATLLEGYSVKGSAARVHASAVLFTALVLNLVATRSLSAFMQALRDALLPLLSDVIISKRLASRVASVVGSSVVAIAHPVRKKVTKKSKSTPHHAPDPSGETVGDDVEGSGRSSKRSQRGGSSRKASKGSRKSRRDDGGEGVVEYTGPNESGGVAVSAGDDAQESPSRPVGKEGVAEDKQPRSEPASPRRRGGPEGSTRRSPTGGMVEAAGATLSACAACCRVMDALTVEDVPLLPAFDMLCFVGGEGVTLPTAGQVP